MDSDSDLEIVEKSTPLRSRSFRDLVKEAENRAHVKACKDNDCKRCLYLRNSEKWQHRLPIAHDEFRARADSKTGARGLGCIFCEAEDVAVGVLRLRKIHMRMREFRRVESPPQTGRAP